jgi:hypothetical protein
LECCCLSKVDRSRGLSGGNIFFAKYQPPKETKGRHDRNDSDSDWLSARALIRDMTDDRFIFMDDLPTERSTYLFLSGSSDISNAGPNKALETTPITPLGLPVTFGLSGVISLACLSFYR